MKKEDTKTLAELVSDLTPNELRLFDRMLREAANEIHDLLMEERKREKKRIYEEGKDKRKEWARRYYLKNREALKARSRRYYYKNKQQTATS